MSGEIPTPPAQDPSDKVNDLNQELTPEADQFFRLVMREASMKGKNIYLSDDREVMWDGKEEDDTIIFESGYFSPDYHKGLEPGTSLGRGLLVEREEELKDGSPTEVKLEAVLNAVSGTRGNKEDPLASEFHIEFTAKTKDEYGDDEDIYIDVTFRMYTQAQLGGKNTPYLRLYWSLDNWEPHGGESDRLNGLYAALFGKYGLNDIIDFNSTGARQKILASDIDFDKIARILEEGSNK